MYATKGTVLYVDNSKPTMSYEAGFLCNTILRDQWYFMCNSRILMHKAE
ncbi:hypothetical protein APHNP_1772 [Anaplasma phagocytophilum str. ApNP]|uniref:Uncharacterized protein n=2 Tax=Anaplasma phagocytophilum TaxID=948 RepID=A0A0F3NGJ1_ANAPH|nr:hypothetical protein APHMUC_0196 [Anaplasma phagocytophilum str. ApMUC09]KJV67140.1 hypothetical protein APHNP_1772 [Anaplasma phagocytophilum str. ApNP]